MSIYVSIKYSGLLLVMLTAHYHLSKFLLAQSRRDNNTTSKWLTHEYENQQILNTRVNEK